MGPSCEQGRRVPAVGGAGLMGPLSSLQVMYFSSLFPYVVLACFLVRGLLLRGAVDGILHMFTPKVRVCGSYMSGGGRGEPIRSAGLDQLCALLHPNPSVHQASCHPSTPTPWTGTREGP